jgi:hypothetical protein
MGFRYIWWPEGSCGDAEIVSADPSVFWDGIVQAGPDVVGSLRCSVINFVKGVPMTCPLDYTDMRTTTAELDPLTFSTALSTAQAHPVAPPAQLWTVIGDDPDRWDVFYAWRNAHRSKGDGAARRVHVFSASLRQNPVGQLRSVPPGQQVPKPVDPTRAAILALRWPDLIEIKGARGVVRRGVVQKLTDALYVCDIVVSVAYEDEEGCMCIEQQELLGRYEWWRVRL